MNPPEIHIAKLTHLDKHVPVAKSLDISKPAVASFNMQLAISAACWPPIGPTKGGKQLVPPTHSTPRSHASLLVVVPRPQAVGEL